MFGHTYFGSTYFGPTYFGPDVGVVPPIPPSPSPDYPGGLGSGGATRNSRTKLFGRLIDEALAEPSRAKKQYATRQEKEAARRLERQLRALAPVEQARHAGTASIVAHRSSSVVAAVLATGEARAEPLAVVSRSVASLLPASGLALAAHVPHMSISVPSPVLAEGITNPTDEELTLLAIQLHQQAQYT